MDLEKEIYLIRLYMYEFIDKMKPVSLSYKIQIHSQRGYIEEGHNGNSFPDFKTWKKIREMFPKCPIKEVAQLYNIPHQILNNPPKETGT